MTKVHDKGRIIDIRNKWRNLSLVISTEMISLNVSWVTKFSGFEETQNPLTEKFKASRWMLIS